MMYTSMHAFEANALTAPIPILFPTVGGCLYSGDFVVRKAAVIYPQFCQFTFEVGQIVEKLSDTDVTINFFATGETAIGTYPPLLPDSLLPYTATKTNMYKKCNLTCLGAFTPVSWSLGSHRKKLPNSPHQKVCENHHFSICFIVDPFIFFIGKYSTGTEGKHGLQKLSVFPHDGHIF
jgi:hypothetical protein